MFLDEKLLQEESQKAEQRKKEQRLKEIQEDFLRQEQEQKTIEEWISELKQGKAEIEGKDIVCERKKLLDEQVAVFIFPEDVDKIFQENNIATIIYKSLGMAVNLTNLRQSLHIKNEIAFQNGLMEQYKKDKITYYPLDTGSVLSGDYKLYFATGIATAAIGGIFIINFCGMAKSGAVTGNYTCQLTKRYLFENLFLAMLKLMYEEEAQ